MESAFSIQYVTAASPEIDRRAAWVLGQELARENDYGIEPVPDPEDWGCELDPGYWAAMLVANETPIGFVMVEMASQTAWYDRHGGDVVWADDVGPLVSFIYLDPVYRGQGIFRRFYLEVITGMQVKSSDVAHLPPFSESALAFHRAADQPLLMGRNFRHAGREAQPTWSLDQLNSPR